MPPSQYSTIVVDPPWSFNDKLMSGNSGFGKRNLTRGAANHYSTLSLDKILSMPISDWAADAAHLYLWAPNTFVREAVDMASGWGFQYKTMLTWVKPGLGMGYYYRNNTEQVIFAVRGGLKTLRKDIPTAFAAKRHLHSEKPQEFYDLALLMSPGPHLDVFARKQRPGFDTWGDECPIAEGLPSPAEVFRG